MGTPPRLRALIAHQFGDGGNHMGRYLLLWLIGVPLPILVLIYAFGGLN